MIKLELSEVLNIIDYAVLGSNKVVASCIGEVKPAGEFYSYDAKYNNTDSKIIIPAKIDDEIVKNIEKSTHIKKKLKAAKSLLFKT